MYPRDILRSLGIFDIELSDLLSFAWGVSMKFVWLADFSKKSRTLLLIPFLSSSVAWAEHIHEHMGAPTFSNPDIFSEVDKDWKNKPFKHDKAHADADLVVALGQQSYPIFHKLIREYAEKNQLNIIIKPGTCGITAGRLRKKSADIGAYCCPPARSDRLPGLEFHSLGISPIALIVHPDNPMSNITSKQAREVFKGASTRWSQLDKKQTNNFQHLIKPIGRLHCKIRPGHWRGLLNDEDQFSPRLFEVGVIPDMISQVSRNTGSIGWEVPLMVSYHQKKGTVRMLKIDGHDATDLKYVLSGKYPLYRSYSLTTWKKNAGNKNIKSQLEAKKLVQYLQKHIEKVHTDISYIPPSQLRLAGWKFQGDELIGEPDTVKEYNK